MSKFKKIKSLQYKKAKFIVDDGKEIIGRPKWVEPTENGDFAFVIEKLGGKDADYYGDLPLFTEDEILSIEELED